MNLIMVAKLGLQTFRFETYWMFCKPKLAYRSEPRSIVNP